MAAFVGTKEHTVSFDTLAELWPAAFVVLMNESLLQPVMTALM